MIKVYGFPRSGNHYLMALLAHNFYPGMDLHTEGGEVGHWSDRAKVPLSEHGKLAGHHGPPDWGYESDQSVYIYRDGRAIATSLYRSPHFKHKDEDADFSTWLRYPLDWRWTTGSCYHGQQDVIEHWREHLELWWPTRVLKIRYEQLVVYPQHHLEMMAYRFKLTSPKKWTMQNDSVGWFPSHARLNGWADMWSDDDIAWFYSKVPAGFHGVHRDAQHCNGGE